MTRFIGYEYITAQAAARRGQNVLGATACLAGGAQLHTRANLLALGGRIDTTSLAEDTFTTFETQLQRAPGGVRAARHGLGRGTRLHDGLWKQRLRWARGNVQVTLRYRKLWFRPSPGVTGLGSVSFGVFWFCLFLQPIFMIISSVSLITLVFRQLPQRLAGLPRPVDHQRRHLYLHHRVRAADRPADRAAHLAAGRDVPWRGEPDHHRLHLLSPAVP